MAVFSTPRINASWLAAGPLLPATARSYRLFARPQRLPPLGDLHSGVKAPSLLLRFLPSRLVVPVRPFGSTTASRFAPVAAVSLPLARCTSTTRFGLPRLRSPLPSGIFTSLGIKVFNRLCCLPVHLTNPPDFLSLPAARTGESWGCGSPFQVRYVSVGLLFLKPLGTFFTMLPIRFSVNAFRRKMASFHQHLLFLFSIVYGAFPEQVLCIKHSRSVLLLRYCYQKCAGLSYVPEPSGTSLSRSRRSSVWPPIHSKSGPRRARFPWCDLPTGCARFARLGWICSASLSRPRG